MAGGLNEKFPREAPDFNNSFPLMNCTRIMSDPPPPPSGTSSMKGFPNRLDALSLLKTGFVPAGGKLPSPFLQA